MSPTDRIRAMADGQGISTRVLLGVIGLLMTPTFMGVGIWVQLNVRLAGIESNMRAIDVSLTNNIEQRKMHVDYRLNALETVNDRWTDRNMDSLQKLNQHALDDAGVMVELPDAFDVKRDER